MRGLLAMLCVAAPALADDTLLARLDAADLRLRQVGDCPAVDVALFAEASKAFGELKSAGNWLFPVAGASPSKSIGGRHGEGYVVAHPKRCLMAAGQGHPAQDLFVVDPDQDARGADGKPFPVLAVDDGVVLVARDGWAPGNPLKGGNYVVQLLPGGTAAYYAHLESVAVKAGDRVARGTVLGNLGRTGVNAIQRRSPTHLHFALFDARTLVASNPFRRLLAATTVAR